MPSTHRPYFLLAFARFAGLALVSLDVAACSPADIPASAPPDVDASSVADATIVDATTASDAGIDPGAATACSQYAYARCTKLETCSPSLVQNRFGSDRTCEQLYTTACLTGFSVAGSGTTVASTMACLTALSGWSCSDFTQNQNIPPACLAAPGTLANGAPCALSTQCQSQQCILQNGGACGVCSTQPAVGASCATSGCGALVCEGTPARCVEYGQLGEMCSGTGSAEQPCAGGLACTQGTCQAEVETLGAPCQFDGAGCDFSAGLSCNIATATCQTAKLVPTGSACSIVGDQQAYCIEGSCVHGKCIGLALPGDACDTYLGPSCITNSRCVLTSDAGTSGTCVVAGTQACN